MRDHTCLITGGTGGIGTAICRRLAKAGAQVVTTVLPEEEPLAIDWQNRLSAEGYDIGLIRTNVSSFESCEQMMADFRESYGSVDVLVNAAGITRFRRQRGAPWSLVPGWASRWAHSNQRTPLNRGVHVLCLCNQTSSLRPAKLDCW